MSDDNDTGRVVMLRQRVRDLEECLKDAARLLEHKTRVRPTHIYEVLDGTRIKNPEGGNRWKL